MQIIKLTKIYAFEGESGLGWRIVRQRVGRHGEWFESLKGRYQLLLETSGVEVEALKKVVSYLNMISLDVKVPSALSNHSPKYSPCSRGSPPVIASEGMRNLSIV
jgi:hypothetical protein